MRDVIQFFICMQFNFNEMRRWIVGALGELDRIDNSWKVVDGEEMDGGSWDVQLSSVEQGLF
jgi:hypothetical protein